MDIKDAQKRSFEIANAHGWWDTADDCNVPTKLALASGELVGEALEEFRSDKMDFMYMQRNPETGKLRRITPEEALQDAADTGEMLKPVGFGVELADAMIRIMDLAEWLSIDLDNLIQVKLNYNETRPMRHGGKKV
jgi:NTP pyrophosphatase (non-canonical NTP hydrolase)